jgi:DNA polymerase-1
MKNSPARQRLVDSYIEDLSKPTNDKRFRFFTLEESIKSTSNRGLLQKDDICLIDENTTLDKDSLLYTIQQLYPTPFTTQKNRLVGIDFETTSSNSRDCEIVGIGLSDGIQHTYIITMLYDQDLECFYHSPKYNQEIPTILTWLNERFCLYAHNAKYEYTAALVNYNVKLELRDTMVMAYIGMGRKLNELSLKTLANQLLDRYPFSWIELPQIEGVQKTTDSGIELVDSEQLAIYCCEDAYEVVLLEPILYKILTETDQHTINEIDQESILVTADMELQGMLFDMDNLETVKNDLIEELEEIERKITDEIGVFIKPTAYAQLSNLFYNTLGIDGKKHGIKKNASGNYSTDEESRSKLIGEYSIVKDYDNYTRGNSILNKYLNSLPKFVERDWRIHTNFDCFSTSTGRLASSSPNLQNIPNPPKYMALGQPFLAKLGKQIRSLFIPSPGMSLIKCDYSQFELRILAHLSNDKTLVDCFVNGKDYHSVVACMLFGIPLNQFDKNSDSHSALRRLAKTINFGVAYGMEKYKLFEECSKVGLNYTLDRCQELLNEYWLALPGVDEFFKFCRMQAIVKGYSTTLWGRKRFYTFEHPYLKALRGTNTELIRYNYLTLEQKGVIGSSDSARLRECQNAPIQGTNADVIKKAMNLSRKYLVKSGVCHLLLVIHDELVFEVDNRYLKQHYSKIQQLMEGIVTLNVPVVADPKIELHWS